MNRIAFKFEIRVADQEKIRSRMPQRQIVAGAKAVVGLLQQIYTCERRSVARAEFCGQFLRVVCGTMIDQPYVNFLKRVALREQAVEKTG
ncbi:MAG TPA: hypothetical protein VN725_01270 [Rhodanobacteraceae bacterium]|nr:hypothetical protein [Rhodanobacteraceae bacterium]